MLLYLCKQTKQHETFNRLKHFTASNYGRFLFSYFFNQLFKQLIYVSINTKQINKRSEIH